MSAQNDFKTLDGTAWANALPAARKRRKGQGKRIAEAIKRHACAKCGGEGSYYYDENHAKPCEACCAHNQGWWQLTEAHQGYVAGADNACCLAGCGQMRRELTYAKISGKVAKVNRSEYCPECECHGYHRPNCGEKNTRQPAADSRLARAEKIKLAIQRWV